MQREVGAKDVREVERNSASESSDTLAGMQSVALGKTLGDDRLFPGRGGGSNKPSTSFLQYRPAVREVMGSPPPSPAVVPVPVSPSLFVKSPSSPFFIGPATYCGFIH